MTATDHTFQEGVQSLAAPSISALLLALFVMLAFPASALAIDERDGSWPVQPPAAGETVRVLAHIHFAGQADVNQLAGRLDVWEVDYETRTLLAYLTAGEYRGLRAEGYQLEVDTAATQMLAQPRIASAQAQGIPGFACYRTVEETYASLVQLATDHAALAQWVDIGDSWQKVRSGGSAGYDLFTLVLTNSAVPGPKPRFFLMAAIHAREYAAAEVATRFAEHLVNGYGVDPEATWLLDYTEIHIVAQANPDGRKRAESGSLWRKNVNNTNGCAGSSYGVDLNRNSSFKWAQCEGLLCSSGNACEQTYRGQSAASEPETQALEAYLRTLYPDLRGPADTDAAPADTSGVMISLHSYSPLILYPWGWRSSPAPNSAGLRALGLKFGYYTGYTACQSGAPGCIYQTDGSTDDWAYGELGVAAYTFELGTAFFQSCSYFEANILNQAMAALTYAAKATRLPYLTPAGPEVVDAAVQPAYVVAGEPVTLTARVDDTRYGSEGAQFGIEPVQNIAAAVYSLETPAWVTGTVTQSMAALDGAYDAPSEAVLATIDTSGWTAGCHTIFVKGVDTAANWGVPTALFVEIAVSDGDPAASRLQADDLCVPDPPAAYAYLPIIGR